MQLDTSQDNNPGHIHTWQKFPLLAEWRGCWPDTGSRPTYKSVKHKGIGKQLIRAGNLKAKDFWDWDSNKI